MVALTLALVDLELVGCVYLYGYQINSITYIGFVMAAGIIMDLTVHGPHYFAWLTQCGYGQRASGARITPALHTATCGCSEHCVPDLVQVRALTVTVTYALLLDMLVW
eukprot:10475-Heterococcus_DN1.PRE.4